jgi:magnesium chelatase subunit H
LDNHVGGAFNRAKQRLQSHFPQLSLAIHAASDWDTNPDKLAHCQRDIDAGDIIIVNMLFMEPHIAAVLPSLQARRDQCSAMVCCMSAAEVMKLTRMGHFSMDGEAKGALALLKRLRGKRQGKGSVGAQQLAILKRLPRILRFIPGTAQDVRAYFLTLQYWLAGSDSNLENMVRLLLHRYLHDAPQRLGGALVEPPLPIEYPEVGLYHHSIPQRITSRLKDLPVPREPRGTVGLLVMRSYALADNAAHYDAVIDSLEKRGLRVITAFASGLDARPAITEYFIVDGKPVVDLVLSLTGFSLVGGPAYNDAHAAAEILQRLDVPYLTAQSLEFQSLGEWEASALGLTPLEATMMVAIPELDGATGPIIFGGREGTRVGKDDPMMGHAERVNTLSARVDKLVSLRRNARRERKVAIVLFNFPPNGGATGSAAHLSVFESLYNTLRTLDAEGYTVEVPESVAALREAVLVGNAGQYGAEANICAEISLADHVRQEPWLEDIEAEWGPAPGRHLTNGRALLVMGQMFGNILVAVQPSMGYEGDPMRLLFAGGHAPTHAFSAFYRYLKDIWCADAVLHFGTHGALEFMPGKQVGLSGDCWPDRLIGSLPNFYLYAANNPSEGMIAKRRSAATLISYLTPCVDNADLYKELRDLHEAIDRWRGRDNGLDLSQENLLLDLIKELAQQTQLLEQDQVWPDHLDTDAAIDSLRSTLQEIEQTLVPYGLHVVGSPMDAERQMAFLSVIAKAEFGVELPANTPVALQTPKSQALWCKAPELASLAPERRQLLVQRLTETIDALASDAEMTALLKALDGKFIPPVAGGDLLKNPAMLPTGRNLHGFDPYRLPSQFAVKEGARQAQHLIDRHIADTGTSPQSVALVLWGTDNLKSEGVAVAQALALFGAKPRFDSYGRIAGAELIPLDILGRGRIDVVMTLSGIFRDLLPLQIRLLAEAALLASEADEPPELNPVRANTLASQQLQGCDFETAALRVFSNAEGAYGSNVNMLIDSGAWENESELANTFTQRKGHAYGRQGAVSANPTLLKCLLSRVDLAYQNLDSVEMGITTVDHYFDTLGGISRAIQMQSDRDVPIYIADHTGGHERVRTLSEQVALESRTRALNPKWYESMLDHGYEGVRAIESHVTNTMGWSATTGKVAPWVYQQLSETFILDDAMRERLAKLNPKAASKVANRLLEASDRHYWQPDEACLDALRQAGEDLEDWVEGITHEAAL